MCGPGQNIDILFGSVSHLVWHSCSRAFTSTTLKGWRRLSKWLYTEASKKPYVVGETLVKSCAL